MTFLKKYHVVGIMMLLLMVSLMMVGCQTETKQSPTAPVAATDALNVVSVWTTEVSEETGGSSTPSSTPSNSNATNAVINESLQDGVTIGTYDNATFTPEGLQFIGGDGYIRFSVGSLPHGYVEFNAKGFVQDEIHGGSEFKSMLVSMWSGDEAYLYETMRYLYEFRKFGFITGRPDASNATEGRAIVNGQWAHGARYLNAWDPNDNYLFRIEWHNGEFVVYRDGEVIAVTHYAGEFAPPNMIVQIGANMVSPYTHRWKEGPHDIVISNVAIGSL